jgi:tetratricopeptide (TPR) repeat protein
LDIDVQIDLAEDVAELARLNRLGWFKQGVILYEEKLKNHLDCFPVVVEYADLLLQQGEYKKALSFTEYCCALHDRTETYAPDEYIVLKSMNAYAAIFATGTVDPAVEALKRMLEYLRREGVESLKATKVCLTMVLYLLHITSK